MLPKHQLKIVSRFCIKSTISCYEELEIIPISNFESKYLSKVYLRNGLTTDRRTGIDQSIAPIGRDVV